MRALRQVGVAADYAAIKSLQDYPAPCAYVILARELGVPIVNGQAPRGSKLAVQQFVGVTFGIVLALRNVREQRGEQLVDEQTLIPWRDRAAIMGFVPDVPGARPCEFVQGDLKDYNAGTALWVDVYQTQHLIANY